MMRGVPFVIDGNNLIHALRKADVAVGRAGLCELLLGLTAKREKVCVIFDGPSPPADAVEEVTREGLEAIFSGSQSADEMILERIAIDTAPRRLTVVSTDREIRRAARKRRCKRMTSEEFTKVLLRIASSERRRPPAEPPEKRHGLTPEQTAAWLREFDLEQ